MGITKEVKKDEGRVSLIPEDIIQFTGLADIFLESGAGIGSGFSDSHYIEAGAKIVNSAEELYGNSDIICKVKEPQEQEIGLLNSSHVLFGYVHLASHLDLTKKLLENEKKPLFKMKKSIVAKKDLKANHVINFEDLSFKSPGGGLEPYMYVKIVGKKLKKDIKEEDLILLGNLE